MHVIDDNGLKIYRFLVKESGSNFNYILADDESGECIVIDPIDVITVLETVRKNDLIVKYVVNTHTHPDHIHGNDPIIKVFLNSKILVHEKGVDKVSPRSDTVGEGDEISLGNHSIKVHYTPGHCPDHIALEVGNYLFIGDTVFVAGCGNTRFGGDPEVLYDTFANKIMKMNENLHLLVGHSYAANNLKFTLSIDPDNSTVKEKLSDVEKNGESVTTISDEKQYNPFMRLEDEQIIKNLKNSDPEMSDDPKSVFVKLRELRNNW